MGDNELVYALAVRLSTPQHPWRARLVSADDGRVTEFDNLAELVRHLAEASLPGPRVAVIGIR
jgi:hypothetical protein